MKNTLILKDGYEIKIDPGSSLSDIRVLSDTKADMVAIWDRMTQNNLSEIQIKDGDGLMLAAYKNIVMDSGTFKENKDGTILTSFRLREKTEVELLQEEVEKIKENQNINSDAIAELGMEINNLTGGF